jgi:hypothetical protein
VSRAGEIDDLRGVLCARSSHDVHAAEDADDVHAAQRELGALRLHRELGVAPSARMAQLASALLPS